MSPRGPRAMLASISRRLVRARDDCSETNLALSRTDCYGNLLPGLAIASVPSACTGFYAGHHTDGGSRSAFATAHPMGWLSDLPLDGRGISLSRTLQSLCPRPTAQRAHRVRSRDVS